MLAKNGYLDVEEVMDIPGFPGEDILNTKKCVVVECKQNIPCNPCESACPHGAIIVGNPITNLPIVDPENVLGAVSVLRSVRDRHVSWWICPMKNMIPLLCRMNIILFRRGIRKCTG